MVSSQVCAAHRLPSAPELDMDSSGHEPPVLMKLSHHLLWLSHHIGDDVPQPAHKSQSGARSVERAVGASHGTTGWACKAATQEADLPRLQRARRGLHREIVGAVQGRSRNLCLKGLRFFEYVSEWTAPILKFASRKHKESAPSRDTRTACAPNPATGFRADRRFRARSPAGLHLQVEL